MRTYTRAAVPAHWQVAEVARVRGQVLTPGRELKVKGERGTFRFVRHVTNTRTGAEWIDVYGGAAGHETMRAFYADKVTRVSRSRRMRPTTGADAAEVAA
jgi:hypothetical protein